MKGAAASKPQPMASEEDDDDILEIIDPQEEDNNQPGPQAGPSTLMVHPLDVDVVVQVNPDPVLSTNPGLASTNESMVPSALSSITNLSRVSNTTATNMAIAARVSGFIQGTLHCQKHVLEWIPYIQAHFPERKNHNTVAYGGHCVNTSLHHAVISPAAG